ncbi:MAG: response regulator transcription factor [Burkholderiales bacterium]|nr:response regulator transcription factor [Burkholderiales bacterium]
MRILLVDDHTLFRAGLKGLLDGMLPVSEIGEASNGVGALEALQNGKWDLLVTDLNMPDMDGFELLRSAHERHPDLPVLVLSMHAGGEFVHRAISLGAAGFLVKDAATEELRLAVEAVARGEVYLSPRAAKQVVAELSRRTASKPAGPAAELPERQREVLKRVAEGMSTKEIAYELGLSAKTVEAHRARLMERVGVKDIAGLVRHAIRIGLVKVDLE